MAVSLVWNLNAGSACQAFPGVYAQRTREIATPVIAAHAPPARPVVYFPIFMEKKMPLCCVLNCAVQEGGWVLED